MKRVVVIGPAYPLRGGIAHFTEHTAEALKGVADVRLISFQRQYPGMLFPGTTQYDASTAHTGPEAEHLIDSLNPLTWHATARAIRGWAPDAVIFMWWQPFFGPAYGTIASLLRSHRCRRLIMAHNVVPHERSRVDHLLGSLCYRTMDQAVLLSDQTLGEMEQFLPRDRCVKLFHPIYEFTTTMGTWTRENARASFKLGERERVVLFFGYVRGYKGVPNLIDAWARLDAPSARLVVAGEFYEDREETISRISRHRLQERVLLFDRYIPNEEVGRFFRAADALVLPYRHASQSGVGTFAVAYKLPLVATQVGGFTEFFREATATDGTVLPIGALAKPEDPTDLARALAEVLDAPPATYHPGLEALRERYSWGRFGTLLAEHLEPRHG